MQHAPVRSLRPAIELRPYQRALLAFVNQHLELADHRRGPELARMAWAAALGSLRVAPDSGLEGDLPAWLARAARAVIREQTSPSYYAQLLTLAAKEQRSAAEGRPRGITAAA